MFRPWGGHPNVGEGAPGARGQGIWTGAVMISMHTLRIGMVSDAGGSSRGGLRGGQAACGRDVFDFRGIPSRAAVHLRHVCSHGVSVFYEVDRTAPGWRYGLRGNSTMTCLTQTYTHTRIGAALSDLAMRGRQARDESRLGRGQGLGRRRWFQRVRELIDLSVQYSWLACELSV